MSIDNPIKWLLWDIRTSTNFYLLMRGRPGETQAIVRRNWELTAALYKAERRKIREVNHEG